MEGICEYVKQVVVELWMFDKGWSPSVSTRVVLMCNKQPRTWIISHGLSKANAICDLEAAVSASVAL